MSLQLRMIALWSLVMTPQLQMRKWLLKRERSPHLREIKTDLFGYILIAHYALVLLWIVSQG
ncbi:hypothetical protein LINPERHAP1_LOCUS12931 [Linum perenne]